MKARIEFTYVKQRDMTYIYIWKGMTLIDQLEMPGIMSPYSKKKVREGLVEKYKDE